MNHVEARLRDAALALLASGCSTDEAARRLYTAEFITALGAQRPEDLGTLAPGPAGDLTARFRAANTGVPRLDAGWRIESTYPSGVVAAKGGVTRTFLAGEFVSHDGHGVGPRAGAPIEIWVPVESVTLQDRYYWAFGETIDPAPPHVPGVRFYWNATPEGSALILSSLTTALNRFRVPFRMKASTHHASYYRVDTCVLYVPARFAPLSEAIARDVHPQVAAHLRPATPPLTRVLLPGLAAADDPPQADRSFGFASCLRIVEAAAR